MLILLMLIVVTGGHRVRHHHDLPRCEEVQEKPRCRRDVSNTMTLRDGENSTLCPNVVCVDVDPGRRPVHIYQVVCQQCGSTCTERGDYRCTQLYNLMEVWYARNGTDLVQDKYRVRYGCVCAAGPGKHAVTHKPVVELQ